MVESSIRSVINTAASHGSMPGGGTNSMVAKSANFESATSTVALPESGDDIAPGAGSSPKAASAAPPANTSLRPLRRE